MEKEKKKRLLIAIILIFLVLIIDQASKFWVKTNMSIGQEFLIFGLEWAKIHFIENEGMAFGLSFGGVYGKIFLSVFRLVAAGFLVYLIYSIIKMKERIGLLVSVCLIFAGAVGNIIDSLFYGKIFSASSFHSKAQFLPDNGGYGDFLMGKVVDMFYFPMFQGTWPDWLPFIGGEEYHFFKHIFNVADASISIGVVLLLIFYRDLFKKEEKAKKEVDAA